MVEKKSKEKIATVKEYRENMGKIQTITLPSGMNFKIKILWDDCDSPTIESDGFVATKGASDSTVLASLLLNHIASIRSADPDLSDWFDDVQFILKDNSIKKSFVQAENKLNKVFDQWCKLIKETIKKGDCIAKKNKIPISIFWSEL